jgi:hypothetical protein
MLSRYQLHRAKQGGALAEINCENRGFCLHFSHVENIVPLTLQADMTASQKLTNGCVAAMALVTAAYLSTFHSSTMARLAFGAFSLAFHSFGFPAKASNMKRMFVPCQSINIPFH